jgi:hypothetical protein
MALYFLDYDLRNVRNYQALYDELARFNAVRVLKSTWCFSRVNTSASNLRDHFKQFIDADDGICVMDVSEWATSNVIATPKALA